MSDRAVDKAFVSALVLIGLTVLGVGLVSSHDSLARHIDRSGTRIPSTITADSHWIGEHATHELGGATPFNDVDQAKAWFAAYADVFDAALQRMPPKE